MLILALGFFGLAALLGFYLLSYVLQKKETPKAIAFIHGPLAVVGLILLLVYAAYNTPFPLVSICLFVLAALGGLILIYKDLTGKPIPQALAIGHGLLALTAFGFLLAFVFLT